MAGRPMPAKVEIPAADEAIDRCGLTGNGGLTEADSWTGCARMPSEKLFVCQLNIHKRNLCRNHSISWKTGKEKNSTDQRRPK